MQRSIIILYGAMLALAITLLLFVITRPEAPLDEDGVRSIVSEMIEEQGEQSSNSNIDKEQLNISIEQYLLSNPRILESMSSALQAENRQLEAERTGEALLTINDLLYNDEANIVLGNPDGDVTLVEFFDYNCPFCKQVMPHIPELLDNDPDLKIILIEFPILGQDSIDVARLSIAVERLGYDYWAFHKALFTGRERVTIEKARKVSQELNINFLELELEAKNSEIDTLINKSYTIAQALNINGTPAFIIGDEIIPGAVDVEELRYRIENMRECGQANC